MTQSASPQHPLSVVVVGASGYAGSEMVRLVHLHPYLTLHAVAGNKSAGEALGLSAPELYPYKDMIVQPPSAELFAKADVVVLALPHGASAAYVKLIPDEVAVLDLSADHRLTAQKDWDTYYGGAYQAAWTYALPELVLAKGAGKQRDVIASLEGPVRLAGPGCNVTAATLALAPALAHGFVDPAGIVVDLAVGYSGAGRSLKAPHLLAAEALGSARAYGVGGTHRHIPEIAQNLAAAAGKSTEQVLVSMTPVLVPLDRGIYATVSAPLSDKGKTLSDEEVHALWEACYHDDVFVRVLGDANHGQDWPLVGRVARSNYAEVNVAIDNHAGRLIALCAIDNLCRGTAGQTLQSFNIAMGWPETTGLQGLGGAL